jgi:uncharacterized protein YqgV (UPF0045/DUF77 family)
MGIGSVLLEFSTSPTMKSESLRACVARSLAIIDDSGLSYELMPIGAITEREWADVMTVVTACGERMWEDCEALSTSSRIDDRAAPSGRRRSMIEPVQRKLGRSLSR